MINRMLHLDVRHVWRGAACVLLLAGLLVSQPDRLLQHAQADTGPSVGPTTQLYFPKTGQTASGAFLAYWLQHRDIGMPVGPYIQQGPHLTQWFEYARLELRWAPYNDATASDIFPVE